VETGYKLKFRSFRNVETDYKLNFRSSHNVNVDCFEHDLLIAKFAAYGLDCTSLKFVKCYMSNRYQRIKVGLVYSLWLKILKGVHQGSIFGALLFNIF